MTFVLKSLTFFASSSVVSGTIASALKTWLLWYLHAQSTMKTSFYKPARIVTVTVECHFARFHIIVSKFRFASETAVTLSFMYPAAWAHLIKLTGIRKYTWKHKRNKKKLTFCFFFCTRLCCFALARVWWNAERARASIARTMRRMHPALIFTKNEFHELIKIAREMRY